MAPGTARRGRSGGAYNISPKVWGRRMKAVGLFSRVSRLVRRLSLALIVALTGASAHAADDPKLALVIANWAYAPAHGEQWPLSRPSADATAISEALTTAGFTVRPVVRNADKARLEAAIAAFAADVRAAGPRATAVFYYAGHGGADVAGGGNYIVPVDASPESVARIDRTGVSVDFVTRSIAAAGARATLVIFDACRNPLLQPGETPAAPAPMSGWVRERERVGAIVSFAQVQDEAAMDDGVYAMSLAAAIKTRGLTIEQALDKVQSEVAVRSRGRQAPSYLDGIVETICLYDCTPPPPPLQATPEGLFTALQAHDVASLREFARLPNNTSLMVSALNLRGERGQNRFRQLLEADKSDRTGDTVAMLAEFGLPADLAITDVAINRLDAVSNRIDVEFRSTLLDVAGRAQNAPAMIALLKTGVSVAFIREPGEWGINAYNVIQSWRMLRGQMSEAQRQQIAELMVSRRSYGVVFTRENESVPYGRASLGLTDRNSPLTADLPPGLRGILTPAPAFDVDWRWWCTPPALAQRRRCAEFTRDPSLSRARFRSRYRDAPSFGIAAYLGEMDNRSYFVLTVDTSTVYFHYPYYLARTTRETDKLELFHPPSSSSLDYWDSIELTRVKS